LYAIPAAAVSDDSGSGELPPELLEEEPELSELLEEELSELL